MSNCPRFFPHDGPEVRVTVTSVPTVKSGEDTVPVPETVLLKLGMARDDVFALAPFAGITEERDRIFAYAETGFGRALLSLRPDAGEVRWIGLVGLVKPAELTQENMVRIVTQELGEPDPKMRRGLVARIIGKPEFRAVWTRPWGIVQIFREARDGEPMLVISSSR